MTSCCKHETLCHCCATPRPIHKPQDGRWYFHIDSPLATEVRDYWERGELEMGNDLHGGMFYARPKHRVRRAS